MAEDRHTYNHHLHAEVPKDLWNRFLLICPERGTRSIIIRRLLKAYVIAAEEGRDTITDIKQMQI